jgi:hypothetical protein
MGTQAVQFEGTALSMSVTLAEVTESDSTKTITGSAT